jgi:transcriptional regulator with XRE-family HTH domain
MLVTEPIPGIGARVRQLRIEARLSQQALAVAAGLSMSVVAQLEQGVRADPKISTVAALARALGVSVDALLEGAPGEPPAAKKNSGKK